MEWRAGRSTAATTCAGGASESCSLFSALSSNDAARILRQVDRLTTSPVPDHVYRPPTGDTTVRVEFYDPLPRYLLAAADFALAARALERVRGADVARGLAQLRSGQLTAAEATLRAGVTGGGRDAGVGAALLGEVLARTGRMAEAEQQWQRLAGAAELVAMDARAALRPDPAAALRRFRSDSAAGLKRLAGRSEVVYLARALLRSGRAAEALQLLEVVRPASHGADLDRVKPGTLILLAHARYLVGQADQRSNHALARGDCAALATQFPVVRPVLSLLQELTAPTNVPEVRPEP
jgi:hypothetical protein